MIYRGYLSTLRRLASVLAASPLPREAVSADDGGEAGGALHATSNKKQSARNILVKYFMLSLLMRANPGMFVHTCAMLIHHKYT